MEPEMAKYLLKWEEEDKLGTPLLPSGSLSGRISVLTLQTRAGKSSTGEPGTFVKERSGKTSQPLPLSAVSRWTSTFPQSVVGCKCTQLQCSATPATPLSTQQHFVLESERQLPRDLMKKTEHGGGCVLVIIFPIVAPEEGRFSHPGGKD